MPEGSIQQRCKRSRKAFYHEQRPCCDGLTNIMFAVWFYAACIISVWLKCSTLPNSKYGSVQMNINLTWKLGQKFSCSSEMSLTEGIVLVATQSLQSKTIMVFNCKSVEVSIDRWNDIESKRSEDQSSSCLLLQTTPVGLKCFPSLWTFYYPRQLRTLQEWRKYEWERFMLISVAWG